MENTNMHENIHTNNKEITPLLSGLGENCENLMLRKVIQNSFSTFTKILRQLNEKRLPYYLCGGTGSLEELYTMGLSKTILGGPYAVCTKCREVLTSDHIVKLAGGEAVTCDKCGGHIAIDGADTDNVYFWHPVNSDVHFEVCVNDEGFKLAHDYIESLIQSLQLSSDELAMTESPTERVLVYRRITVKCDGTVPNKHYRGPQFVVLHDELDKFIEDDLRSGKSILAPDYTNLVDSFSKDKFQIIALQRGDVASSTDRENSDEFFEILTEVCGMTDYPMTPEDIYNTIIITCVGEDVALKLYEWFISSAHPISIEALRDKFENAKSYIYDIKMLWMSRIINMKSRYENKDFVAMHYLLSL